MPSEPLALPPDMPAPPRPWWRRALPFVVTVALLGVVLGRIDFHAFLRCLAAINAPRYLLSIALFLFALLTVDTFATVVVYRRTIAPVRFRDFWLLRGASYLPSILNHHVGQAFITYFLSRNYGVPLSRVAGATMLVYLSWIAWIVGAGVLALALNGQPLAWAAAILVVGIAYLALITWKPARLAKMRFMSPLFEAGLSGHLVALAARLPHFLLVFAGTWASFLAFDIDIPLRVAVAYVPLLMVAVSLPITPQGFGTRDVLAVVFFERFAPGARHEDRLAALAAATTSWGVTITLIDALLGLLLIRWAFPGTPAKAIAP
ncbi:MAG: lysylphosphatidylglycerol synthase domain-containing protein [Minicystis sp.]